MVAQALRQQRSERLLALQRQAALAVLCTLLAALVTIPQLLLGAPGLHLPPQQLLWAPAWDVAHSACWCGWHPVACRKAPVLRCFSVSLEVREQGLGVQGQVVPHAGVLPAGHAPQR